MSARWDDDLADPLEGLRGWQRKIDALPPRPREIRTSDAVPSGRCCRQWMTNGDLIVWANTRDVASLPRVDYGGIDIAVSTMVPPGLMGVPVIADKAASGRRTRSG